MNNYDKGVHRPDRPCNIGTYKSKTKTIKIQRDSSGNVFYILGGKQIPIDPDKPIGELILGFSDTFYGNKQAEQINIEI